MSRAQTALDHALRTGIAPTLVGIYDDIIAEMVAASSSADEGGWAPHCAGATAFARTKLARIAELHSDAALFNARFANVSDEKERHAAILDFARKLGSEGRRLRGDRRGLSAYFDDDAVRERYRRRVGEAERALAFALERAGLFAGQALANGEIDAQSKLLAQDLANLLVDTRAYRGDARIRQSAHRALKHIAELSSGTLDGFWVDVAIRDTRRAALDATESTWAQCDAFDTLLALSPTSLFPVLDKRLAATSDRGNALQQDNRLFVRRHLARMLARAVGEEERLATYLRRLANDRDGAVRQAVAESLPLMPAEYFGGLSARLRVDRDPQVRAMLFADPEAMIGTGGLDGYMPHLLRVLSRDEEEFVLRVAIRAAAVTCEMLAELGDPALRATGSKLRAALGELRERVESQKIRRWAGEASERIWLACDAEACALANEIASLAAPLREGSGRSVPQIRQEVRGDPDKVGRVLAVLAQGGFGFDLTEARRPRLIRGERFKARLWRILFELGISATDKRQAFRHTIGRDYEGTVLAPPARMAELAPTKVPGEPLFVSAEGGWRNYLPLLDHVLSAIDQGRTVRIFTSEGRTLIVPPSGLFARFRTYWKISRDFARLSGLRNKGEGYAEALAAHGVALVYEPYEEMVQEDVPAPRPDPSVVKLFELGGLLLAVPVLLDNAVTYFATVFANTLVQLGAFVAIAFAWFFGRHIVLGWHARRVRRDIPLVLGGWGTRGKSGTERLKAGLINALGPPLVSKTTGCEAMFLQGEPFGGLTEMFLFRPYDKATIWEQYNLISIARRLKARVFLWECMGLNPAYVRVLQQDWMRDDIGTITNTYPDHEDVQGPAGRNIPEVMCEFIPHDSILLTTEEEMLPILQEGAEKANTRLRAVNWLQAGLIHERLLDRFPYAEHPYNIALVTAMGDELGLEADFCIKEMSDRVVADLGVLKIYPRSTIDGRTLEFVMGMSANERFGAMGNWDRMGFADHTFERDPGIFVSTVVNNRADRVPRSRVFARMLVNDVSADRHVLIGSNIEGLIGFIEEEWDAYAAKLTLVDDEKEPLAILDALAENQRIPHSREAIAARIAAMLTGLESPAETQEVLAALDGGSLDAMVQERVPAHADEIAAHAAELGELHARYEKLRGAISSGGNPAGQDGEMRALMRDAFMRKLVPVRDFYMKGENIVRLVARQTPPGLVNRIMGMQNIKGTGLDWVYRWQAWETVHRACEEALGDDPALVERGLAQLQTFQEFGVLSERKVEETVGALRNSDNLPQGFGQAQLDGILARLKEQVSAFGGDETADSADSGAKDGVFARFRGYLLDLAEGFLDGGDAIKRRRKADRIYRLLIEERISTPRAALELKKLTSRQKGGWLGAALAEMPARLGRN
ncbi:hypothetical protein [Erythrobacter sp. HKB08]|uniref:hypothetical protein n=1 Tax=Erythrobacter sp. HKB08 TaxID=2502843 RepID=UPI001008FF53|nr:hypothetical protein [Erythrobacter sp. HKB08]